MVESLCCSLKLYINLLAVPQYKIKVIKKMIGTVKRPRRKKSFPGRECSICGCLHVLSAGRAEVCPGARVEQRGDEAGRWSAMGGFEAVPGSEELHPEKHTVLEVPRSRCAL